MAKSVMRITADTEREAKWLAHCFHIDFSNLGIDVEITHVENIKKDSYEAFWSVKFCRDNPLGRVLTTRIRTWIEGYKNARLFFQPQVESEK